MTAMKMKVVIRDDQHGSLIGTFTPRNAAEKMGIPLKQLVGFLDRDGYCLVDTPAIMWAEWGADAHVTSGI